MDFLVRIDTSAVAALRVGEREQLVDREWSRGRELHEEGILRRLWRLPGQKANIGLWSVRGPDELHEALASLPIWPWVSTEVTALAAHPLFSLIDAERRA